jgi:DNA-binding PadR family transcriptional regulator
MAERPRPVAANQARVLAALAGRSESVAGIELARELAGERAARGGGLGRSSVYAALAALQRDGLVAARWDHSASHPRRLVRITARGRRVLAEQPAPASARPARARLAPETRGAS